jgi:hypothetical protein
MMSAKQKFKALLEKQTLLKKRRKLMSAKQKFLDCLDHREYQKRWMVKWRARRHMYSVAGEVARHDIDCESWCDFTVVQHMMRRCWNGQLIALPEHYADCHPECTTMPPSTHAYVYWINRNQWLLYNETTPTSRRPLPEFIHPPVLSPWEHTPVYSSSYCIFGERVRDVLPLSKKKLLF